MRAFLPTRPPTDPPEPVLPRGEEVFKFDTRGNVEEPGDGRSHRAYGAGNRLERKDNAEYVWDADGRLVERCEATPNGPKVWRYEWARAMTTG